MRFLNLTINQEISFAISSAESLLSLYSPMIKELNTMVDHFKYDTPQDFIQELLKERPPINVLTYKSKNPWSKAVGYYLDNKIFLNLRKLPNMNHEDLVGFLLHEYAHYCGLNHGTGRFRNFKTQDKVLYSVPYYLSENVGKWL